GRSRGSTFFRNQSFTDKLDEYEVLFNWLSEQPGVDTKCMGIHGMSEGGRLSIDLAARLGNRVAFVNSVAAPFASYADNQLYAIRHFMHQSLVNDSLIAATTYAWSRYFNERANGSLSASTRKMITQLRQQHGRLYLPSTGGDNLIREDINFESVSSLAKVTCPVLFQWGANDERVDAPRSMAFIREHRNNRLDWIRTYPESSHSLTDRWMNTSKGYFADKVGWLQSLQILTP
ncbi:MAG: acyl-CoA thioester hydrolase/BAAT C-terminal domain-containing protein, partial [Owenweeksia sp.]